MSNEVRRDGIRECSYNLMTSGSVREDREVGPKQFIGLTDRKADGNPVASASERLPLHVVLVQPCVDSRN